MNLRMLTILLVSVTIMVVEINCSTTLTTIVDGHKSTKTIVRREIHADEGNTKSVVKSINGLHLTNPKRLLTELKIGEQSTEKSVTTNSETEKGLDSQPVTVATVESDIVTESNKTREPNPSQPSVTEDKFIQDPNSVLTRSGDVDETTESKENLSVRESTSPSDKLVTRQGKNFNEQVLDMHNSYRSRHGVGPLTINQQLNKMAQEWAQHLASIGSLTHRPNNKYGENLYYISTRDIDGETPVKAWYDEIKLYNFNSPKFSSGTGHFTQVVWKISKELGIGKATGSRGTFVVCNYNPPGNFLGQFPQNVFPPKSN